MAEPAEDTGCTHDARRPTDSLPDGCRHLGALDGEECLGAGRHGERRYHRQAGPGRW